ncbi:histidine--tRNA ligase, partial [Acidianus sp. DSM 29099]
MISYEPLRGTKDYFGKEAYEIEYIINSFIEVAEKAGYTEAITPLIEQFELFSLKGGEELRKTMYVFMDKGGR